MENNSIIPTEEKTNPLQGLPHDIICELFNAFVALDPPRAPGLLDGNEGPVICGQAQLSDSHGSLGWITATHVCQRWRMVGLDLASLWAAIVCVFPHNVDAIETIVERSKSAPLTLDLHKAVLFNIWDIIYLLDVIPRVKIIQCTTGSFEYESHPEWPASFLNQNFSALRVLSLTLSPSIKDIPKVPLVALALRELSINAPLPISAPFLKNMRATGRFWRWRLLLDYLRHYPTLEKLHLEGIVGDISTSGSYDLLGNLCGSMDSKIHPVPIAQLQHLRSLTLDVPGAMAVKLLKNFEAPALSQFHVRAIRGKQALLEWLTRFEICKTPRDTLSIAHTASKGHSFDIRMLGSDSDIDPSDRFERGFALTYGTDEDVNRVADILRWIPDASSIRTLVLTHICGECNQGECGSIMRRVEFNAFATSLKSFCNVTSLHLIGQEGDDKVPLLLSGRGSTDEYLLPALRELIIHVDHITSRDWWSNLCDSLSERQTAGYSLDRLVIRGKGACHAYWPGTDKDQGAAYLKITKGLTGKEAIARWLQDRELSLERERGMVTQLADERVIGVCDCAKRVRKGTSPWYMPRYVLHPAARNPGKAGRRVA